MSLSRRQFISLSAAAPLALALSGCSLTHRKSGPISERIIDAVATTGMVGDLVLNVAGNRAEVDALMGPGVDPHLFKASERTLRTMERADIVFYNGLHLEGGLSFVLEEMGKRQPTWVVSQSIPEERLRRPPEFEGNYDPHIWFDVSLWTMAAESTIAGMQDLDPTSAELYATNGEAYLAELRSLEEWVFAQVEQVPTEQRVLITAHDAFGYFGARYGFEVRGIQGASTATEAGAGDLQDLAEFIATRRIPAIFVESSVPRRTIEALREAVRSRGFEVRIGGELFSDAMGTKGTPEGTYLGMVRHNVNTIVNALLGKEFHE
ncbi:MAG: zinc ABC transporter substrate-binding protein [Chloroflexota bacterium]|nr:zinc ABC transporter substrate-binding protein [Chloroflexota bacterium]